MERASIPDRTDTRQYTAADRPNRPTATRRQVLAGIGTSTLGLAGCQGGNGPVAGESGGDESDGGSDGGAFGGSAGSDTNSDNGDSDGGDSGGVNGGGSTSADNGGAGGLGDPDGSVAENDVDGLAIASLDSSIDPSETGVGDATWATEVTVETTGSRETELLNYDIELTVYGSDGQPVNVATGSISVGGDDVAPGGSTSITLYVPEGDGPSPIERYEVSLTCDTFADGVYCEG